MGGRVATKEGPESRTVVLPLAQPYACQAWVTESLKLLDFYHHASILALTLEPVDSELITAVVNKSSLTLLRGALDCILSMIFFSSFN